MTRFGTWRRTAEDQIVVELSGGQFENAEVGVPETGALAQRIKDGNRDESDLTNRIFWDRHPELQRRRLFPHERTLAAEWLKIRNEIVRPALASQSPQSSRWLLPESVRVAGEAQRIAYDAPGPWRGEQNCTGTFTAGAAELGRYITQNFPGVTRIDGYDCRQNTANAAETSVHGTGRAIDIMIPPVAGAANTTVGDPIANWLVQNAAAIGVQYVIWNRSAWGGHYRAPKQRRYGGPNPHIDHVHAEITQRAAERRTPWFSAAREVPLEMDSEPCSLVTCSNFSPTSLHRGGTLCRRCRRRFRASFAGARARRGVGC